MLYFEEKVETKASKEKIFSAWRSIYKFKDNKNWQKVSANSKKASFRIIDV